MAGYFDEARECVSAEDYDFWLRVSRHGKIGISTGALSYYQIRRSGLSGSPERHFQAVFYVIRKAIDQHVAAPVLADKDFFDSISSNIHRSYRRFAYDYYYRCSDRIKAKTLLFAALRKYPFSAKDWLFFMLCWLPESAFRRLRKLRRLFLQRRER